MKDASQYPVSFPYGATSAPYSSANPHRGIDFETPMNTPLKIAGVLIGQTGNSGSYPGVPVYVPHLHIQAGRDEYAQQPINPAPYMFKPGTVVHVGWGDQWGNYVGIRVVDVSVYYCHLNGVNVKVGQVIGGSMEEQVTITLKEYKDLVDWKARGIDAKYWKDALERSKVWPAFQGSSDNVVGVLDGLLKFRQDHQNGSPSITKQAVLDYINQNLS